MLESGQEWGKLGSPSPLETGEVRRGLADREGDREVGGVKGHNRTKIMETERQWGTLLRDVGQHRRAPT